MGVRSWSRRYSSTTGTGAAGLKNGDDEGQSARTDGTSLDTWHRSLRTPHVLLQLRHMITHSQHSLFIIPGPVVSSKQAGTLVSTNSIRPDNKHRHRTEAFGKRCANSVRAVPRWYSNDNTAPLRLSRHYVTQCTKNTCPQGTPA